MSFSFNWSGLSVPQIAGKREIQLQNQQDNVAGKLGAAAWGMQKRAADEEYANILNQEYSNDARIKEIQSEITRLEQRNAEIRQIIGGV